MDDVASAGSAAAPPAAADAPAPHPDSESPQVKKRGFFSRGRPPASPKPEGEFRHAFPFGVRLRRTKQVRPDVVPFQGTADAEVRKARIGKSPVTQPAAQPIISPAAASPRGNAKPQPKKGQGFKQPEEKRKSVRDLKLIFEAKEKEQPAGAPLPVKRKDAARPDAKDDTFEKPRDDASVDDDGKMSAKERGEDDTTGAHSDDAATVSSEAKEPAAAQPLQVSDSESLPTMGSETSITASSTASAAIQSASAGVGAAKGKEVEVAEEKKEKKKKKDKKSKSSRKESDHKKKKKKKKHDSNGFSSESEDEGDKNRIVVGDRDKINIPRPDTLARPVSSDLLSGDQDTITNTPSPMTRNLVESRVKSERMIRDHRRDRMNDEGEGGTRGVNLFDEDDDGDEIQISFARRT